MAKKKPENDIDVLVGNALIKKDDQPYPIPDNWVYLTFDIVCSNETSSSKKIQQKDYLETGIIAVVDQGINFIGGYTNDEDQQYDGELPVIIFGDHTRIVKYIDFPFAQGADGVKILKPSKIYIPLFLYYYLLYLYIPDMGYRRHFKFVKEARFPLPPLQEQKRIVQKLSSMLEKLKQAKELICEAKETFENRRAAILDLAFTGKLTEKWREKNNNLVNDFKKIGHPSKISVKIPESWAIIPFGKIAAIEANLVDPRDFKNSPHIAPNNIEKKTGRLLEFNSIEEDGVKSPKHFFRKGQIIYSKIRPYLSKVIIAEFDGLCSADMYPISTELNTLFLYNFMLSQIFLNYATNAGSRTVLPKINQKELNRIPVICPPLREQKEIVRILDSIFSNESESSSLLELEKEIELIEKSILSKAFRGELDTNDPDDEPAQDLLKRILHEREKVGKLASMMFLRTI